LEYSHSIEVYCFIRSKFRTLNSGVEELKENLRNTEVIDFEQYFAMLAELYASLIQVAMEESVKILYEQGMEYADEEIFYQDYHLEFECFQEALKPFAEKCDNLNKEYYLKQDLFQIEKASRSHWTGGGFGLKGAIKGAATAKCSILEQMLFVVYQIHGKSTGCQVNTKGDAKTLLNPRVLLIWLLRH